MKKIIAAVLALCLLVGAPAVMAADEPSADYSWYGDGSAAVYDLYDVDDLLGFADIVNGKAPEIEKDSFAGKTVQLNADVDLTGVVWTPIGSSMYDHVAEDTATKKFEGTFDGGNHTITGLSSDGYILLSEDFSSGEHSFGLFGYAYGANIKNVKLAAVDIDCCATPVESGAAADGSGVAALVGFYVPKHNASSVIENCHLLSGTVIASNNMGGLIGFLQVHGENVLMDVTVKGCSNAAAVTTKAREAGGILGLVQLFALENATRGTLSFVNCINYGDITAEAGGGTSCAGGILGWENTFGDGKILIAFDTCVNEGDLTAIGSGTEVHAAGMGSTLYNRGPWLSAVNCSNKGNIVITNGSASESFAGGIFAYGRYMTIENCTSTETVSVKEETTAVLLGELSGGGFLCLQEGVAVKQNSGSIFLLNGGTAQLPALHQVLQGQDVFNPSAPTREHFTFGGWYKTTGLSYQTPNYEGAAAETFPMRNTYHAKWIPDAPKIMVSDAGETEITLTATHPVEGVTYTWYKDGELISGETGSTLEVSLLEEVSVQYTAKAVKDTVSSEASEPIKVSPAVSAILAAIEIESAPYAGVYDGEKHSISVSCSDESATIKCYADASCIAETDGVADAGEYSIYYKISKTIDGEVYDLLGSESVSIERATLTVTADNKYVYVGGELPTLTYTVTGFVGSETFIIAPDCAAPEADMEKVGRYVITVSGGTVSSNYTVEYVEGTLTVSEPPAPGHSVKAPEGALISPANPQTGALVTATVKDPAADGVRVVDSKGNLIRVNGGDGVYSFIMPDGDVSVVPFENPFADSGENDYFHKAVLWAYANGVTQGTAADAFTPDGECSRAQIVTFLWRAAGCPTPRGTVNAFADVAADSYYSQAVLWAAENGITAGVGEDTFAPDAVCSRAQIATFLCRMVKGSAQNTDDGFTDVEADAYYAEAVRWAQENGIAQGTAENVFSPNSECTRGQAVTFLYRCLNK